jgi:hypothetical protein
VGGAVAGVAAVAAAAIGFFLFRRKKAPGPEQEDLVDDSTVTESDKLPSQSELGEDHRFVSEYGLSDHGAA